MKTSLGIVSTALLLLCAGTNVTIAADTAPIYGSQLMTRQERIEHRNQMRTLKTEEERNAYRLEHHNKMQERAKERGVTLPDSPPAAGGGMGPGAGGGRGPGAGAGGGRGRQ